MIRNWEQLFMGMRSGRIILLRWVLLRWLLNAYARIALRGRLDG